MEYSYSQVLALGSMMRQLILQELSYYVMCSKYILITLCAQMIVMLFVEFNMNTWRMAITIYSAKLWNE